MCITTATVASTTLFDAAATRATLVAVSPSISKPSLATQGQSPHAFIRPYDPETDRPGVEAVFKQIYTPLYAFSGLTTIAFVVFCRAYLDLSPDTCFVLASAPSCPDEPPRILGYIVGAPDSVAFCTAFAAGDGACRAEIEDVPAAPTSQEMLNPQLRGQCMQYFWQRIAWVSAISSSTGGLDSIVFAGAKAPLREQYPAHFHVAVLPEVRRCGFGPQLAEMLSERLAETGVGGVNAAVPTGNEGPKKLISGVASKA